VWFVSRAYYLSWEKVQALGLDDVLIPWRDTGRLDDTGKNILV